VSRTLCLVVVLCLAALAIVSVAGARIPPPYKNCTAVNKKYPHGIGRAHAYDKTSGTPVTTFVRSDRLYRLAMSYNAGLDRDKDGIACEKA
jgi:Excalibur calcium-binding domain